MDSPYYVHPSESPATTLVSPLLNVSPSISQSILWIDKADEICDELRERFSQGKLIKIVELQESTTNLKQGVLSVTSYFTKFKTLWDELDNLNHAQNALVVHSLISRNAELRIRLSGFNSMWHLRPSPEREEGRPNDRDERSLSASRPSEGLSLERQCQRLKT
ncbi:hypothetical protein Lal_00011338 [Lupinus albus]|nr:hypothetical protein Lal_00011338 [Lupinus albus]